MREKLLALMKAKNERKAAIVKQADTATEVEELRKLNKELDGVNEEIRGLQEMIDELPEVYDPTSIADPDGRTAAVNGTIPGVVASSAKAQEQRKDPEDKYGTLEYRMAFMESVCRGTPIAPEYRADAFTTVADTAAVIPTNIMNEIIKEMKVRGQIYRRCRPTNLKGGVRYPISTVKPVAKRITETGVSDRQKLDMSTYVSFGYLILECRVATSMLASIVSLPVFEAQIVPLIVEAMTTTNEYEVFNGNGTTEMMGILTDTRVKAAQKVTLSSAEFKEWDKWKKKVFAKVPLSYRNYAIYMGAGTFDGYIDGMVDTNGQPIGRTNYGITDGPIYRFGGKEVVEVEEDVIKGYDNASVDDVVAVFVDLGEYAINSNMQMAMYRWFDHDTNQWVDKAILINDGKLLDPAGVIIVKKGA